MQFSNIELFYGKSHFILISSIIGALSNIILNYIFIHKYGYIAAGYTTVVGYLLMCLGHFVFTKITCEKEDIPFRMIFDMKLICSTTAVLFVLCALVMLLYNTVIWRYFILLAVGLAIIIARKHIIRFIKNLREAKKKKDEDDSELKAH